MNQRQFCVQSGGLVATGYLHKGLVIIIYTYSPMALYPGLFTDWTGNKAPCRHGICQKVYAGQVFKDQILLKSVQISMNARLRQNSVNDGKIQ